MIVLYIGILIYFNVNITSIVNVFMLSIEKKKELSYTVALFCMNSIRVLLSYLPFAILDDSDLENVVVAGVTSWNLSILEQIFTT